MTGGGRRTKDEGRKTVLLVALLCLSALGLGGCVMAASGAPVAPATFDTGVNPDAWATVPAGEFLSGQHEEKVIVSQPYEVMVTDVTNARYARYLNAALTKGTIKLAGDQVVGYYGGDVFHGHKHEEKIEAGDWLHIPLKDPSLRLTFDGKAFAVKPGYEAHPMTVVTWFGATAYCDFYGWRLPSETEWEKAARGTDNRPFPWGDEIARNSANFYSSRDPFEKLIGSQGDTTPVGFYNGKTYDGYQTLDSPSPYGLYDMAGNVWQWTSDVYEGVHYRYLRGGSKGDYGYSLRVWTRNSVTPVYASPSVGFRCAR
ncbi:MAG: SUMF1/EgtB/PvdO family nonheme iron enzyme [Chloroflexi bacterium]|nr:SUMF1/EgtB/PvdO family nonheme iron enzyme [Chloroflexota bacterium]